MVSQLLTKPQKVNMKNTHVCACQWSDCILKDYTMKCLKLKIMTIYSQKSNPSIEYWILLLLIRAKINLLIHHLKLGNKYSNYKQLSGAYLSGFLVARKPPPPPAARFSMIIAAHGTI